MRTRFKALATRVVNFTAGEFHCRLFGVSRSSGGSFLPHCRNAAEVTKNIICGLFSVKLLSYYHYQWRKSENT